MKIANEPGILLELMMKHEEVIGRLYECYAKRFPDYWNFWSKLSEEEIQHANWIDILHTKIEKGYDFIVVERFPIAAIESSINFVNSQIAKAEDADFKLINALSIALDLEKALLECECFKVFDGDSEGTIRTLKALVSGTREHYKRIRKMWQKYQVNAT